MKKSPNYASHRTSELGLSRLYPYSNPSTPCSDKCELATLILYSSDSDSNTWLIGQYFNALFWSTITACLCENVPLYTSSPLNLTLYPSFNKLPKARDSAVAQSIWILLVNIDYLYS